MTHRRTATTRSIAMLTLALSSAPAACAGVSGSVSLTSDYLFRGVSQTNQDPALQAGLECAATSGLYAGAWGSNISWLSDLSTPAAPISSSLEFDVYGGYRGTLGEKASFDVGAIYYAYPGDFPEGFNRADTGEVYAGVTLTPFQDGSLGAKYSHAVTDLFGYPDSDGSGYLELNASWEFTPGWSLTAHAGHQWIAHNEAYEYADWKLGLSRGFDSGFSLAVAWSGTDADRALYTNPHGHFIADEALTLAVTKTF